MTTRYYIMMAQLKRKSGKDEQNDPQEDPKTSRSFFSLLLCTIVVVGFASSIVCYYRTLLRHTNQCNAMNLSWQFIIHAIVSRPTTWHDAHSTMLQPPACRALLASYPSPTGHYRDSHRIISRSRAMLTSPSIFRPQSFESFPLLDNDIKYQGATLVKMSILIFRSFLSNGLGAVWLCDIKSHFALWKLSFPNQGYSHKSIVKLFLSLMNQKPNIPDFSLHYPIPFRCLWHY